MKSVIVIFSLLIALSSYSLAQEKKAASYPAYDNVHYEHKQQNEQLQQSRVKQPTANKQSRIVSPALNSGQNNLKSYKDQINQPIKKTKK